MIRLLIRKGWRTAWLIREQDASARLFSGSTLAFFDRPVLFASAMLKWRADGFRLSPDAVSRRRLSICASHHECWKSKAGVRYCARCGCTALKQRLPASRCPRGLW